MCRRASAEAMPCATPTGCMMAACIQRWICSRSRQESFRWVMISPVISHLVISESANDHAPHHPHHHSLLTTHPFFAGASPNFLPALAINSSKRLRALGQVLSLKGTAQPPLPLQSFWPGCSPQPPWPLQSFMPLQSCAATVAQWAWPAHSLVVPGLPLFLQVLMPRQTWGSFNNRLALSSAPALGVFSASGVPLPAGLRVQPA